MRCGAALFAGCLLAFGLVACRVPRPALERGAAMDPAAALAAVRAREERITSLRARFRAETRRDGDRHSADGVLLVKKPDRFRLRMMLPFGLTVFDYVSWGERAQLALPMEGRVVDSPQQGSPAPELAAFSREDLGQAFLRGPNAFPGTCAPLAAPDGAAAGAAASAVVVGCMDGSGLLLRQIRIDARQLTIDEETSYVHGQPHMVIRYAAYRSTGDTTLPYRISLGYPGQQLQVDISIERYELNPSLPDDLFRPVRAWAAS